jgi:hypothetical protein
MTQPDFRRHLAIRASDVLVCIGALVFLGLVWMDGL